MTRFFWPFGESIASVIAEQRKDIYALQFHRDTVRTDAEAQKIRDINLVSVQQVTRFVVAGLAWLQQRIISSSSGHIERHRRKQLAREYNVPPPSDVKVIQLRRTEPQPHHTSPKNESPEWSCRWLVSGHWRNQPYKDERKLIYIMPYVKGPDDKPLKVPTHTVYQVSR